MVPTKTQNYGIVPKVGEQIVSGSHIRDSSVDQAIMSRTGGFGEKKSLHGYRGYGSKKYAADTNSKFGKLGRSESINEGPFQHNLRDNTVGPYTTAEHKDETLSRAKMRNFNQNIS